MLEDSFLLILLHSHHQPLALQFLQEALKVSVEIFEVGHLAHLVDVLFRHVGDLEAEPLSQQSLGLLYFLDGVLLHQPPDFRVRG